MKPDSPPVAREIVHLYVALNILGIVLLLALIITIAFSRRGGSRIKRDPTVLNCYLIIILVNFIEILYWLVLHGDFRDAYRPGAPPFPNLCIAQACILAGAQAAQAAAVFAMLMRLWLTTMKLSFTFVWRLQSKVVLGILLALPYLCLISFVPPMAIFTSDQLDDLAPTPFYCGLSEERLRPAYSKIASIFAILCLVIELHLIYMVARQFRNTTQIGATSMPSLEPERSIPVAFYVRVATFMAFTLLMIASTLFQAFDTEVDSPVSDMIFACVAPLAFVCFATQPDILRAWRIPALEKRIRKWFGPKRHKKPRVDEAWAGFLGRDDSESTLDAEGVTPVERVVPADERVLETIPLGDIASDKDSGDFDIFAALNTVPPDWQSKPSPSRAYSYS